MPQKFPLNFREESREEAKIEIAISTVKITNPENYLILPGKSHGSFSYLDSYVAMHRLSCNEPDVQNAARTLGLTVRNTAQEKSGYGYIGQINWKEALSLNLAAGNSTLNPREGIDFILLLKNGIDKKIQVYNGLRQPVSIETLKEVYDEMFGVRDPLRLEWLDGDFKVVENDLWIYSNHILREGNLEPQKKEKLLECLLTKGEQVRLDAFNDQGLPTQNGKDIYYWCPDRDNKSVAWVGAGSDRAGLGCGRDPSYRYDALGVRAVRRAGAKILGGKK